VLLFKIFLSLHRYKRKKLLFCWFLKKIDVTSIKNKKSGKSYLTRLLTKENIVLSSMED